MTIRTLAEAAAEILNQSKAKAPSDPAKKIEGEIEDLGGSTKETPEGNAIGKVAASKIKKAPVPSTKPSDASSSMKEEEEWEEEDEIIYEEKDEDEEEDEDDEDEDEGEEDEDEYKGKGMKKESFDVQESEEVRREMILGIMKDIGIQEDVEALFAGEELSEEFQQKAATIFEAAVISRAMVVAEALEEEIMLAAQETVEEIKEEMEQKIDSYMSYVAEDWKKENKIAIQEGLRTEITEEFIDGLRNLFVEHYIEIPEDKYDVISDLSEQVQRLQEKLDSALEANIEMHSLIEEAVKGEIILEVCEDLTATQTEKMKSLAESVEFTAEGEYREKLEILKENYFSRKVKNQQSNLLESHQTDASGEEKIVPADMQRYVDAISRTIIK
jgi:hypothetical protein